MPAIQNVERRGAVYYWRRSIGFPGGNSFTLRISLLTRDQGTARRRAVAMTARSEDLRAEMATGANAGLTMERKAAIFRQVLVDHRDHIDRVHVAFQKDQPSCADQMLDDHLEVLEHFYRDVIAHGFPEDFGSTGYLNTRFGRLNQERRDDLAEALGIQADLPSKMMVKARAAMADVGAADEPGNAEIARKVILEGKLASILEFRRRIADPISLYGVPVFHAADMVPGFVPAVGRDDLSGATVAPLASLSASTMPAASPAHEIEPAPIAILRGSKRAAPPEADYASLTPVQAAARFVAENPKASGGGGRRQARWTVKTRGQFETAAMLLEKSYGARPLGSLAVANVVLLNGQFDRLPATHHKSSRHNAMTLQEICDEAAAAVAAGTMKPDRIGLGATTTNRHFGFLRELCTWLRKKVPGMEEIDWRAFMFEDDRTAREQRDAYSVNEGRQLFRLPIWIGCRSLDDRLRIGIEVWHDAGYWVLLIAWYTGLRREEICKLKLDDIGIEGGIWFFDIRDTDAGRTKNRASHRLVPFASELDRLGLRDYVRAMRDAGETLLFPELVSASGKQVMGDGFYRLWWTKIAAHLDFIKPGQALHAFRHMVGTELKDQHVFEEDRADLIGHTQASETAGRYAKAARLNKLKDVVDRIPVVTDRLKVVPVRLLPVALRAPRRVRADSRVDPFVAAL